jgi:MSHA biogenesis protein MshP
MTRQQQSGMSLVVALFLIVVIASLAAFATTFTLSQREQTNLQLQSERALEAARAGAEWAAYRALVNNACAATTNLNLTQGALNGFAVNVRCQATAHTEGAVNYRVYNVTSFAQYGRFGAAGYVSRSINARYTNAP